MNIFISKNNQINIDYVFKVASPKDRSNNIQNNEYKAFIFSYLLGSIYKYKTIHNYKTKPVRDNVCKLLNISDRSFHRYLKICFDKGYVFIDSNNKNVLRITGINALVDRYNEEHSDKEEFAVKTYYKTKIRLKNLDFEDTKLAFDTALLRYFEYKEEISRALSIKYHIHRSYRHKKKNFLLSFGDRSKYGSRTIAKALSSFYSILTQITNNHSGSIENIVYKKFEQTDNVKKINGMPMHTLYNKEVYSEYLNKSLNSAVISLFNYFSLINIDSVYLADNGSFHRGNAMGYTKSGFCSFAKRAENKGFIKKTSKFAYIASTSYETYVQFKKEIVRYCKINDRDDFLMISNRIIYKHGSILFQRENHIKVDTQVIKFSWDRFNYSSLINENPNIEVKDRYERLNKKLGANQFLGKWYSDSEYDASDHKSVVCMDTGKVYSSFKKINNLNPKLHTDISKGLRLNGEFSVGGLRFKFYHGDETENRLILQDHEQDHNYRY